MISEYGKKSMNLNSMDKNYAIVCEESQKCSNNNIIMDVVIIQTYVLTRPSMPASKSRNTVPSPRITIQ